MKFVFMLIIDYGTAKETHIYIKYASIMVHLTMLGLLLVTKANKKHRAIKGQKTKKRNHKKNK